MKIEKEIIYSIVTSEGCRIEVSEQELAELYLELSKLVPVKNPVTQMRIDHD
jgi:hypothetical protein